MKISSRQWMLVVVLVSMIVKFIYVFYFTPYQTYLVTDCGEYWKRATERFLGNVFSEFQWSMWPPMYHIILAEMFKVINFFGGLSYSLEIILIFHILLSSASVYILYLIALEVTRRPIVAFLSASSYAFSYGFIYFSTSVLSENFSIPLVIFAIWLLFREQALCLALSGVFIAVASGMRPVYLLLAVLSVFFLCLSKERLMDKFKKITCFGLSFIIAISLILFQNQYISGGKLKGLSGYGGANLYLAFTKVHTFWAGRWCLIPPATVEHPENGIQRFQEPMYNNDYYYKMAIEHIKNNPRVLLDKFKDYHAMFFGIFVPYFPSALWFNPLMLLTRWEMLLMTLFSLFVGIVFKSRSADNNKLFLLVSFLIAFIGAHYFFNPEFRYFLGIAFVVHITFFATLVELWKRLEK